MDASSGEIITFLDDDNTMHPDWVRTIVWAFTTYPEYDVLYGARLNEDPPAKGGVRSGMLPTLEFSHYDRRRHEQANYIDRNAYALRSSLSAFRFDEGLHSADDWEHQLRVFESHAPLALPAIGCRYLTVHSGRLSDRPSARLEVDLIRDRHRARTAARRAGNGEHG